MTCPTPGADVVSRDSKRRLASRHASEKNRMRASQKDGKKSRVQSSRSPLHFKLNARPAGAVSATGENNKFDDERDPGSLTVARRATAESASADGRDGVRVRPAARGGARGTARCAQSRPARAREKRSPPQLPDHALSPSTSPLPEQVARWPSCGASSGTRSTRSRCPIRRRTPRSRVCCATRAPESCGFSRKSRGRPRRHRAKMPRPRSSRATRRTRSRISS